MIKNKQNDEELNTQTAEKTKTKGSAGYKMLIVLLLLGGIGMGGYYWQTIQKMQAEIDGLKQTMANNTEKTQTLIDKVKNHFQDSLYNMADNVDKNYNEKTAQLRKELQNEVTQLVFGAQSAENVNTENKDENTPTEETAQTPTATPQVVEKIITIEREKTPQEVLLAAGAIIVKDMAENGLPIEYETEVLQILAEGNSQAQKYVATAQEYAASGLLGRQVLIKEYNKLYASLNNLPEAENKTPEIKQEKTPEQWWDKVLCWLKHVIIQKKKVQRPEFKAETDEIYELVNAGKFTEALAKMKTDAKYTSVNAKALTEWQKQVSDYIAFENAMKGLIMNALANIRLKEMER